MKIDYLNNNFYGTLASCKSPEIVQKIKSKNVLKQTIMQDLPYIDKTMELSKLQHKK